MDSARAKAPRAARQRVIEGKRIVRKFKYAEMATRSRDDFKTKYESSRRIEGGE